MISSRSPPRAEAQGHRRRLGGALSYDRYELREVVADQFEAATEQHLGRELASAQRQKV